MIEEDDEVTKKLSKPEIDEFYEMRAMLKFSKKDMPENNLKTKIPKEILELKAKIVVTSCILSLLIFIFQVVPFFDYVYDSEGYSIIWEHTITGMDIILSLRDFIVNIQENQIDMILPFYLLGLFFLLLGLTSSIKSIIAKKLLTDNIDTKLRHFIAGSLLIILDFLLFYFTPNGFYFIEIFNHSVHFYLGFYIVFGLTTVILIISIKGLVKKPDQT